MTDYGRLRLCPSEIRFCQDSISGTFMCRIPIWKTFEQIINKEIIPDDIPSIEVAFVDGSWWASTGNRRLYIYKKLEELGVISTIPVFHWSDYRKNFTTVSYGLDIKCRQPMADRKIKEITDQWKNSTRNREAYRRSLRPDYVSHCRQWNSSGVSKYNDKTPEINYSRPTATNLIRPSNLFGIGRNEKYYTVGKSSDENKNRPTSTETNQSRSETTAMSPNVASREAETLTTNKSSDDLILNNLRNLSMKDKNTSTVNATSPAQPQPVRSCKLSNQKLKPKPQAQFEIIHVDDDRYYVTHGNKKVLVTRQYGG